MSAETQPVTGSTPMVSPEGEPDGRRLKLILSLIHI